MDQDKEENKEQLVPKPPGPPGPPSEVVMIFEVESYRFYALFAYCLSCIAAANLTCTFVSVASVVADIYEVSDEVVNSCMIFQYASTIIIAPLTAKGLEKFGMKNTFKITALVCIVAMFLRWFLVMLTENFYTIFIGQFLIAIVWPFYPSSGTKIASVWFPADERAQAGSMGLLCIAAGFIISCVLGPIWIVNSDSFDKETGMQHVNSYLFVQVIITVVLNIPQLFVSKAEPDNYPSLAAKMMGKQKLNFKEELKTLFQNKNFVKYFFMITLVRACRASLSANFSTIWTNFNFSTSQVSLFGGVNCGVGIIGGMVVSRYVDRSRNYMVSMKAMLFSGMVVFFSFTFTAPADLKTLEYLLGAYQAAVLLPATTIGQTLAVELSYPVSPNVSNGVILSWAQIQSVTLSYILTEICDHANPVYVFVTLSVIMLIAFFILAFVEEDLRRLKALDAQQNKMKEMTVLKQKEALQKVEAEASNENDDYNKQTS